MNIKNRVIDEMKKILNNPSIIFIGIIFTLLLAYFINPFINIKLEKWDRSISSAVFEGLSIGKRVGKVYIYNYVLCPVLFLASCFIAKYWLKDSEEEKRAIRNIGFVNLFLIAIAYINRFRSVADGKAQLSIAIVSLLTFYIAMIVSTMINTNKHFRYDDYILLYANHLFLILCLNLPFGMLGGYKILCWMSMIVTVLETILFSWLTAKGSKGIFYRMCSIGYYVVLCFVIALESIYIAVSKGIRVRHHVYVVALVVIIFTVITVIISIRKKANGVNYMGLVISTSSILLLGKQYKLVYDLRDYATLFEIENRAIFLETIDRGKLPIIEYFPAHAIKDFLSPLAYWLAGGDKKTVLFSNPWSKLYFVLSIIVFFIILKYTLDKNWAILLYLVFPFAVTNVFYAELAFVEILGVIGTLKRPNKLRSYIFLWLAIAIGSFSCYDTGISMGIACVIAIVLLIVMKCISLKRTAVGFAIVTVPALMLYIAYSWFANFNWVSRIKEWLYVGALSSGTWATVTIGDPTSLKFFIVYELIPLADALLIFATIILLAKYRSNYGKAIVSFIFSVAYAMMITRTLVFHNLSVTETGWTGVVLNFFHLALFFFAIYVCEIFRDAMPTVLRRALPIVTLGISLAVAIIIVGDSVPSEKFSFYADSVARAEEFAIRDINIAGNEGTERTEYSDYTKEVIEPFERIFNLLLEDNQTFIDFANATGLYAFTNRECPSYVCQTPSLLSNEPSHEMYLEEIEAADAPLAVLGISNQGYLTSMGGTKHNIRYYKIAEYLYAKYCPLISVRGDFAIWCRKDKFVEYTNKLNHAWIGEYASRIYPGYDTNGHSYSLSLLPYIWANFDLREAINNDTLVALTPEKSGNDAYVKYHMDLPEEMDTAKGQYVSFKLECTSEEFNHVTMVVTQGDDWGYSYDFLAKEGKQDYLIRISSDYYWHFFSPDTITFYFENNSGIVCDAVQIIQGD